MNDPNDVPEVSQLEKGGKSMESLKESGREVLRELVREVATTLKWALRGGIVSGVLLGGLGLILMGWPGCVSGFLVGVVFGGLLTVMLYLAIVSVTCWMR